MLKIMVLALVLTCLPGCADVIFTASGALAPKVAMGIAAATGAATLAKSSVEGVTAVEEFKAMMRGRNAKPTVTVIQPAPVTAATTGGKKND